MSKQTQNPLIKIEVSGGVASYQIVRGKGKVDVEFVDHDDCEAEMLEGNWLGACSDCRAERSKKIVRAVEVKGRNTKR